MKQYILFFIILSLFGCGLILKSDKKSSEDTGKAANTTTSDKNEYIDEDTATKNDDLNENIVQSENVKDPEVENKIIKGSDDLKKNENSEALSAAVNIAQIKEKENHFNWSDEEIALIKPRALYSQETISQAIMDEKILETG